MKILGISAFYHDSAAALIVDGKIVCAAQEERFTRIKHDFSFPLNSIKFCLDFSKITINDLDFVVFYEKPFLKFERLLETYIGFAPKGFESFKLSMPTWVKDKLFQKNIIKKEIELISKKKFDGSKAVWFSNFCELSRRGVSVGYSSSFQLSFHLVFECLKIGGNS